MGHRCFRARGVGTAETVDVIVVTPQHRAVPVRVPRAGRAAADALYAVLTDHAAAHRDAVVLQVGGKDVETVKELRNDVIVRAMYKIMGGGPPSPPSPPSPCFSPSPLSSLSPMSPMSPSPAPSPPPPPPPSAPPPASNETTAASSPPTRTARGGHVPVFVVYAGVCGAGEEALSAALRRALPMASVRLSKMPSQLDSADVVVLPTPPGLEKKVKSLARRVRGPPVVFAASGRAEADRAPIPVKGTTTRDVPAWDEVEALRVELLRLVAPNVDERGQ